MKTYMVQQSQSPYCATVLHELLASKLECCALQSCWTDNYC